MNGQIEELLRKWLDDNDICYYSLVFTECYGGVISITFFSSYDISLYLDLIKYKSKFNKSNFIIIQETTTVLVVKGEAYEIIRTVRGIYNTTVPKK